MNISKYTSKFRTELIINTYKKYIKNGDKILDIGCGTGVVAKIIKNRFQAKITGCDVANYLITDIPFIQIKNNKISAENNSYDIAFLNDVLHHINKDKQSNALLEATRTAKKVLIFEFEPTFVGKLADIILNKFHYGNLNPPLSVRTLQEWQILFKELGLKFKILKVKKTPFWYPFSHIGFMVTI